DTFPMGVHFKQISETSAEPETQQELAELEKSLSRFKVILSIDRLDYTKGTINRLRGYEAFLRKYPEWLGKAVLVLVVVPSRVGVEEYRRTKRQVDELVGRINGTYGRMDWTPIRYQYRFLPFRPLIALYNASDVALVTPLRDGMNLIAKEYLAARTDNTGVLILSEMAGAVKELGEAVIINPNDIEEIADALKEALEMPEEEQRGRNEVMRARLARYDVVRWADDFIQALLVVKEEQSKLEARLISPRLKQQLVEEFSRAEKRAVFLDYEGVLVPFARRPRKEAPPEEVKSALSLLSADERNDVVVISGRDRETMTKWFGDLNIGMVAEHGVWVKQKNHDWETTKPLSNEWKTAILPVLEMHVDRLPGSFVEEKEYSVVWNYRNADPELASTRSKEVMDDLVAFTANIDVQVLQGNQVVEVRSAGVDKGMACLHWLAEREYDFVLGIGDDVTDEDMFRALPRAAYTVRVGAAPTHAKFTVADYRDAVGLVADLSAQTGREEVHA
ncbi:MAG: bifunctional alpha,alpha-trehalose-phosphate synthase (UDP-forming)/trehalose-phosphatase, partial [Chloroflexota bacterium]